MALIDKQNKIVYWDEVNWQWLPFMVIRGDKTMLLVPQRRNCYISINSKEGILRFLEKEGYSLFPLNRLGIMEISKGCYLYDGKIYSKEGIPIKSLPSLLVMISGKSFSSISKSLKGKGLISESIIKELVSSDFKFEGKVYKSYGELAKEFGIPTTYLVSKLSEGFSLEEAINSNNALKEDHLGNKFNSEREMAEYWGISYNTYRARKSGGWSLEKALTTPVRVFWSNKECVDFKGKTFPSIRCMAEEYGVSFSSLSHSIRKGKTPAEALKHLLYNRQVTDHKGKIFPSQTKMAEYYNVHPETIRSRIKSGWSLEEALTGKRKER